jgi:hypothetical protein
MVRNRKEDLKRLETLPQPRVNGSFEEFAVDLRTLNEDPDVDTLVVPAFLHFRIPEAFPWQESRDHFKFTKLQVCLWLLQDENFTKPVHLDGVTSIDELRLIAGLGSVQSATVLWTDSGEIYPEYLRTLAKVYAVAGDDEGFDSVLKAMEIT